MEPSSSSSGLNGGNRDLVIIYDQIEEKQRLQLEVHARHREIANLQNDMSAVDCKIAEQTAKLTEAAEILRNLQRDLEMTEDCHAQWKTHVQQNRTRRVETFITTLNNSAQNSTQRQETPEAVIIPTSNSFNVNPTPPPPPPPPPQTNNSTGCIQDSVVYKPERTPAPEDLNSTETENVASSMQSSDTPPVNNDANQQTEPDAETVENHDEDMSKSFQGYFCVCGTEFSCRSALYKHIRTYSKNCTFQCDLCDERYPYFCTVINHKIHTHKFSSRNGGRYATCNHCGKTIKGGHTLFKHRRLQPSGTAPVPPQREDQSRQLIVKPKRERVVAPEEVNRNVNQQGNGRQVTLLRPHTLARKVKTSPVHSVDQSKRHHGFYCTCGTEYSLKSGLDRHIKYMSIIKTLACSLCPRRFRTVGSLNGHMLKAHQVNDVTYVIGCWICGVGFNTRRNHAAHRKLVHGTRLGRPRLINRKRSTRSKLNVRRVNRAVTVKTEVTEPDRPSTSSSPEEPDASSQQREMQIDSYCGSNGDSNEAVAGRFASAASTLPEATTSSSMRHHQITRTEPGHLCTCGKEFNSENNLQCHICYHNQDWRFRCDTCNKNFLFHKNFDAHMKNMHGDETTMQDDDDVE